MMSDDGSEDQVSRLRRQQGAIVALARRQSTLAGDLQACMREITWVGAVTLRVRRASVWLLSEDRQQLECLSLYEREQDAHSSGVVLTATDYPRYFAALESGRAIDAHDAAEDARTSEFREGYLEPLGITSMMDAAIRDEGRVIGVVCHEHVGSPREWTTDEIAFAGAVADQAALALAAAARHRLEAERDRMQHQLLHVQKLESLGVLAGGLAHDFNNLLTIIRCNVGIARNSVGDGHIAFKPLEAAIIAADRAAAVTRQLLAYSGSARAVVEPVHLGAQVIEIATLVSASIPKHVHLEITQPGELPTIRADTSQIQQLIMNLMLNAAEAIEGEQGHVHVRLTHEMLAEPGKLPLFLFPHMVKRGRVVILEVADDGVGIEPQVLAKMFDPFYSTKGPGRGLGLASVAGIVRSHGAGIAVQTKPGSGTTFRVYFQAADEASRHSAHPAASPAAMVLVIDDEPAIVTVAQQILADAGYAVAAASAVRDGIALLARYREQVRAVLVNLTMPEMSGIEVLGELRRLSPGVAAVLMSGWDAHAATQKYIDMGVAGFLQKPFTPEELLARVAWAVQESRVDQTAVNPGSDA